MKRGHQQELKFPTGGRKRRRPGRKRALGRGHVPHRARPEHKKAHPVHVTLRAAGRLPSLRKQVVVAAVRRAIGRTPRSWFRIVQFSVQSNHMHLLVEADDKVSLARGLMGAAIRIALAVNRVAGRRGRVWEDRYHSRSLRTPREVRHGIVYVLMNWKKHMPGVKGFDPCSSAMSFTGWSAHPSPGPSDDQVEPPESWLMRTGWKRHGLIASSERPNGSLGFEED